MTNICSRCGKEYDGSSEDSRSSLKEQESFCNHTIPPDAKFCLYCYQYLIDSSKYYRAICDSAYSIKSLAPYAVTSRYNPVCRDFDIIHGFLNPDTNTYWDE